MMKFIFTILILFTSILYAKVLTIDETIKVYDVLLSSQIYIDKTRKLTKDIKFEDNDKKFLGYGYSPNFDVWIKFTLKNNSDQTITKILEYGNSMATDIIFYDIENNTKLKEGLLYTLKNRNSINPVFKIRMNPHQTKTYYIKASSYVTTLIVKLQLYVTDHFYTKELNHQAILFLFFGAMMVLAVYNLFICFFTKDISYLWYVLYVISISLHHTLYVGIANLYIFDNITMSYIVRFASLFIAIPIFFLALFLKSFLHLENYSLINKILDSILIVFIISLCIYVFSDMMNQYRNVLTVFLLLYLIIIAIYLAYKRNRQAYFIVIGWFILFLGILSMYLSSAGIINLDKLFPYIVEVALLSEIILFSIALADKINILHKEKNNANKELLYQKETENERLEQQVLKKTKDLNISLDEKTLLLKELNHRVKNNMQMIISLIRLQSNGIEDIEIRKLFLTMENRLSAMSQLQELLYQKDDISYINAYEYFTTLIEGLEETYTKNVHIQYRMDSNLLTEHAISCGIIVNELVTNSLKYAFTKDKGQIDIYFTKESGLYTLVIQDNGVGYDKERIQNSFGLVLVTLLVESKLGGTIVIDTKCGVKTKIIWREEDEEN